MIKGKRKVDSVLQDADTARTRIAQVVDVLQAFYEEKRPVMSAETCSDLIESLIYAEDAIREAKARLEEGV